MPPVGSVDAVVLDPSPAPASAPAPAPVPAPDQTSDPAAGGNESEFCGEEAEEGVSLDKGVSAAGGIEAAA